MELLAGKAAVVTGGTNGIGRAITLMFAEQGADVVVADIEEEPAAGGPPTAEAATIGTDASATFVECDVTDYEQVEAAVAAADAFGGVDVMVNNAGIGSQGRHFLEGDPVEAWERTMAVNARGVYFGSRAAGERMLEAGGGAIVNMSSTSADFGRSGAGGLFYCASKGAVVSLTRSLAHGLGPDVRVNAIKPGFVAGTEIAPSREFLDAISERWSREAPLARAGKPEEIATVATFLASDLASFVTAEAISVDGGWSHTTAKH